MIKSTLKFDLELDENNVPIKIVMNSSHKQAENINLKSVMIAAWDENTKETLRVDLWTKDMIKQLKLHDGSLKNIIGIPESLKNK